MVTDLQGRLAALSGVWRSPLGAAPPPAAQCVGVKSMYDLDLTVALFRKLREAWFISELKSHAHEREWESEDREAIRQEQNKRLKQKFDEQTEGLLLGVCRQIAPKCLAELAEVSGGGSG